MFIKESTKESAIVWRFKVVADEGETEIGIERVVELSWRDRVPETNVHVQVTSTWMTPFKLSRIKAF